jgi:hypothetical protein
MRQAALLMMLAGCGQSLVDFFTGGNGPNNDFAVEIADLSQPPQGDGAMGNEDLSESGDGSATDAGGDAMQSNADMAADLAGNPDLTPPANCSAAHVAGGNDRINAGDIAAQDVSGALTVEAWIYPTMLSGANQVIAAHWSPNVAAQRNYRLRINGNDELEFNVSVNGGGTQTATSAGTVTAGAWTHVAGVFQPSATNASVSVFIDGTGTANTGFAAAALNASNNGLNIGNLSDSSQPFNGYLSDARVEAAALYTADFTPPATITAGANTVALYHFTETSGTTAADSATGTGRPNNATLLNGAAFAMPPVCR